MDKRKENFESDPINMSFQIINAFMVESLKLTFKPYSIFRFCEIVERKAWFEFNSKKRK